VIGTLGELAARVGGSVVGDAAFAVERITAVDDADATTLTFAVDAKYFAGALKSKAGAVLVDAALLEPGTAYAKPLLAVAGVRLALAALLAALEPPRPQGPFTHPSAAVDPTAELGAEVWIGPHVSIAAGARIGAGSVLHAGVAIGTGATLGAGCTLHPRAYVADGCELGARVVLQSGAVIGGDGFGWAFLDGRLVKIPQIGIVRLGDDVEVGANSCIDRAQTGVTEVGEGTKIDNLVQIGHNCRIGRHCAIAAFVGMAGTTVIGDYVQVGGAAMFKGHISVGDRSTIAGAAHVWGDLEPGSFSSGRPAQNHRDEVRLQAYIRRLPKISARVDALERGTRDE
jgi:UDP-3-O-[3-hydroxymyristoyl] glucosamine N-acyltransferase